MHRFAKAAGRHQAMVRVFTDCGLRLGRFYRFAGKTSTARPSRFAAPPTRARSSRERRPTTASPTPAASSRFPRPSPGCSKPRSTSTAPTASSSSQPPRPPLPAQEAPGLDTRPHECHHSYVTHLRAAGVNDADLAQIAGHRIETVLARHIHPLGNSFVPITRVIG